MPKNKYDLEVLIPVSGKGIFGGRLFHFKNYGLLNCGGIKIKLVALTGTEQIPDMKDGWNENINVTSIQHFNDHPASKIYNFFAEQDPKELNADWYMRIDDDSITNIEGLMTSLAKFDSSKSHYFATYLHFLWDGIIERKILADLKYPQNIIEDIRHEHECCVVSHASMKKILSNKKSKKIFELRGSYPIEVCDRCFGCGAHVAGERPVDVPWLDRKAKVCKLSCFGGDIHHVHEVSYDKNEASYNFVREKLKTYDLPPHMKYKVIQQSGLRGMGYTEPFEIGTLNLKSNELKFNKEYNARMTATPSAERMSAINSWLSNWMYNKELKEIMLVDECGIPLGQFTKTNQGEWLGTLWEGFNVYKLIGIEEDKTTEATEATETTEATGATGATGDQ